jgi:hypothetical protein
MDLDHLICAAHEMDDDLPTVKAVLIHKGESLCLDHFLEKREEEIKQNEEYQRQVRLIDVSSAYPPEAV